MGPGKKNKPGRGKIIGGNMSGEDPRELANEFAVTRQLRPGVKNPIWHCSLSLPPGENLTAEKWREVVDIFLKDMKIDANKYQYTMIQHSDTDKDHIHLIVSRISLDGKIWYGKREAKKAIKSCRSIEKKMGLQVVKPKLKPIKSLKFSEIQMAARTGKAPVRAVLQRTILKALDGHPDISVFLERMEQANIVVRPNIAKTGRMNGFSFGLDGIFFKGSQLGQVFTWKGLQKQGLNYDKDRDCGILSRAKELVDRATSTKEKDSSNRGTKQKFVKPHKTKSKKNKKDNKCNRTATKEKTNKINTYGISHDINYNGNIDDDINAVSDQIKKQEETMENSNVELERFKTEIDLSRWLEAQDWQKDYHTSCRSSAVLRKDNDKIVVSKQRGNFVYKNTKNPGDQGSIIDYIQKRKKFNLGQVRKILRPVLYNDNYKPLHDWKAPKYAINQAQNKWLKGQDVFDYTYLQSRGIKKETVKAYAVAIKQDSNKNLMFLHHQGGKDGYTGYEIKGPTELRGKFSAGGEKSFFPLQREKKIVSRIVVTEAAIDALSYAQMDGMREDTAYVSTAGNLSGKQLNLLFSLCSKKNIKKVVLGQNNDEGGDKQVEKCKEILKNVEVEIEREIPECGYNDWNQMLTEQIKRQIEQQHQQQRQQQKIEDAKKRYEIHQNRKSLDIAEKMVCQGYDYDQIVDEVKEFLIKGGWQHEETAEDYAKVTAAEAVVDEDDDLIPSEVIFDICSKIYDAEIALQKADNAAVESTEIQQGESPAPDNGKTKKTDQGDDDDAPAAPAESPEIQTIACGLDQDNGGAGKTSEQAHIDAACAEWQALSETIDAIAANASAELKARTHKPHFR